MLPQEELISRVRELCEADRRLVAALQYGSFVSGEGDAFSDVEFWLFAEDGAELDPRAWLSGVGTALHVVVNEFGSHVVIFEGLVRGEFHFATGSEIAGVAEWPARGGAVEDMIVLDRTGELRRVLESLPDRPVLPELEELGGRFVNWLVLAHQVTRRGELLRAVDALEHARRHLLWMVRLGEGRTRHWLTPSRAAEGDLPGEVLAAVRATTATAEVASLTWAVAGMWALGRRYWPAAPKALVDALDGATTEALDAVAADGADEGAAAGVGSSARDTRGAETESSLR